MLTAWRGENITVYVVELAQAVLDEPRFMTVESCLRAHSPGSGRSARLGAVAFIHRFGSTLNPHLHFHCVVIDGVFDSAAAGGVVFHAATGLEAAAIADVQAGVRRRLLRVFAHRGLLPSDDAQAMGQWAHGGGFSVDASVRIEAADRAGRERLLRYDRRKSPGGTAPGHRSPWTGCANSVPNACSMSSPSPVPAGAARCS